MKMTLSWMNCCLRLAIITLSTKFKILMCIYYEYKTGGMVQQEQLVTNCTAVNCRSTPRLNCLIISHAGGSQCIGYWVGVHRCL